MDQMEMKEDVDDVLMRVSICGSWMSISDIGFISIAPNLCEVEDLEDGGQFGLDGKGIDQQSAQLLTPRVCISDVEHL